MEKSLWAKYYNDKGNDAERGLPSGIIFALSSHITIPLSNFSGWFPGPGEHASSSSGTSGRWVAMVSGDVSERGRLTSRSFGKGSWMNRSEAKGTLCK